MLLLKALKNKFIKNGLNYCRFKSTSNALPDINHNYDNINNDLNKSLDLNDFNCLATNRRMKAKINLILNEYELYRSSDEYRDRVPLRLSVAHMRQLLHCNAVKKHRRVWIDLSVDQRRHLLYLMKRLDTNDGTNQLATPVMPIEFEKFYTNRLKIAALFGQNIIFDISFDNYMSTLECKNLAEQLNRIYRLNRYETMKYSTNELPFNINLCNVNNSEKSIKFLDFLYPEMRSKDSFVNISSESYLDLFPSEQLVYLSPHADDVMTEYDHNSVFIIGGIVDRSSVITLSAPKAKQQNIRSVRLPIEHLITKTNIQSLDSVFKVLFDFKVFGINNKTISLEERVRKHLPRHKLKSVAQKAYEHMIKEELNLFDQLDNELNEMNADFQMNCK